MVAHPAMTTSQTQTSFDPTFDGGHIGFDGLSGGIQTPGFTENMLDQPLNNFPISSYDRGNNVARDDQDPDQELDEDFSDDDDDDEDFPHLAPIREEDEQFQDMSNQLPSIGSALQPSPRQFTHRTKKRHRAASAGQNPHQSTQAQMARTTQNMVMQQRASPPSSNGSFSSGSHPASRVIKNAQRSSRSPSRNPNRMPAKSASPIRHVNEGLNRTRSFDSLQIAPLPSTFKPRSRTQRFHFE